MGRNRNAVQHEDWAIAIKPGQTLETILIDADGTRRLLSRVVGRLPDEDDLDEIERCIRDGEMPPGG